MGISYQKISSFNFRRNKALNPSLNLCNYILQTSPPNKIKKTKKILKKMKKVLKKWLKIYWIIQLIKISMKLIQMAKQLKSS